MRSCLTRCAQEMGRSVMTAMILGADGEVTARRGAQCRKIGLGKAIVALAPSITGRLLRPSHYVGDVRCTVCSPPCLR